jgi:hypothetical protein
LWGRTRLNVTLSGFRIFIGTADCRPGTLAHLPLFCLALLSGVCFGMFTLPGFTGDRSGVPPSSTAELTAGPPPLSVRLSVTLIGVVRNRNGSFESLIGLPPLPCTQFLLGKRAARTSNCHLAVGIVPPLQIPSASQVLHCPLLRLLWQLSCSTKNLTN